MKKEIIIKENYVDDFLVGQEIWLDGKKIYSVYEDEPEDMTLMRSLPNAELVVKAMTLALECYKNGYDSFEIKYEKEE